MSAFCSQTCVQPPCHPSLAAPSCGDLTVSTWYDSHLNLYEVEVGLDDAGAVEPVCHSLTLVAEDGGILVSKVFSGEDVVFIATPQNKLLECGTPFYAQAVVCEAVGCTAADLHNCSATLELQGATGPCANPPASRGTVYGSARSTKLHFFREREAVPSHACVVVAHSA